jgi:hypothetical protein
MHRLRSIYVSFALHSPNQRREVCLFSTRWLSSLHSPLAFDRPTSARYSSTAQQSGRPTFAPFPPLLRTPARFLLPSLKIPNSLFVLPSPHQRGRPERSSMFSVTQKCQLPFSFLFSPYPARSRFAVRTPCFLAGACSTPSTRGTRTALKSMNVQG